LTPTPPRVNPRGEKGTGKKGKGSRTGLSPAREKKTEPGRFFAGLGQRRKGRGQAARRRHAHPLGSTRAGEGAGDGAMVAPPPARSLGVLSVAAGYAEREESGAER